MLKTDILFRSTGIGAVVAFDVSEDEYMADYAAHFCEWIDGVVIKMAPVHAFHDNLDRYLSTLLSCYLELNPIGVLHQAPFVMQTASGASRREPDIQVILGDNQKNLTPTMMQSAADIVIEIVSDESRKRDYGEKFHEYEAGGVREYWIIDPHQKIARFYRLDETGVYDLQQPENDDIYQTPLLTGLKVDTRIFWQKLQPGPIQIVRMVQAMLDTNA